MILVINPGSSSLKYKLFDTNFNVIKESSFDVSKNDEVKNFKFGAAKILGEVADNLSDISKIGIRIVHGGPEFKKPTLINKDVIKRLKPLNELAPLHNPYSLDVIDALLKKKLNIDIYAVFDTSFFNGLKDEFSIYPINTSIASKYKIQRYGFHGISHEYIAENIDPEKEHNIISIHLGAGCSLTAISKGKPVITSMGFTPLEGLMMQTRSGDIDPGIIFFLVSKLGAKDAKNVIEKNSGLKGLTGTDGNMFNVLYAAGEKIEDSRYKPSFSPTSEQKRNSQLALRIYTNKIREYIGSYSTHLEKVDKIVFSGKIGYGSSVIRNMVMKNLKLANNFDVEKIKPNEELAIAIKIK